MTQPEPLATAEQLPERFIRETADHAYIVGKVDAAAHADLVGLALKLKALRAPGKPEQLDDERLARARAAGK